MHLRQGRCVFPRHELIDTIDLVIWDAFKHPGEPGLRIDAVHFSGLDEGVGDGSCLAACHGAHEEVVLAARCDVVNAALTDTVVEFQAPVAEIGAFF